VTTANRSKPRIGFISLGQGPRPDLDTFHRELLAKAGRDIGIVWRHALEGLGPDKLDVMSARDGAPAIRSNIRENGARGPLGAGWTAKWFDRDSFIGPVQASIRELETDENVDLTIVCAAEEFPDGSFVSTRPVIFPPLALSSYAQALSMTRPSAKVAMLVYGDRQRDQQKAGWAAKPWARSLDLVFCGHGGDIDAAGAELTMLSPDIVLVWAYGAAVGEGDALSARLGVPVITAASASVGMALNLLPATDAERRP